MKRTVSLILAVIIALGAVLSFASCGRDGGKKFKIGICNYVDDASLNQIVENMPTVPNSKSSTRTATPTPTSSHRSYQTS